MTYRPTIIEAGLITTLIGVSIILVASGLAAWITTAWTVAGIN